MTLSVRAKLILCVVVSVAACSVAALYVSQWSFMQAAFLLACVCLVSLIAATYLTRHLPAGLKALELGLLNIKDGEYSTTVSHDGFFEFTYLCALLNQTSQQLRNDKHWLFQRELLLDKITQSSPESLFLVNNQQQIVFSNIAARRFLGVNNALEGKSLTELLGKHLEAAAQYILSGKEGLFTLSDKQGESQTWYLSTGTFTLNNQPHTLYILKHMTRELSRQEVAVWKKVIRVISHELNNSLGPISSMLHSGKLLTDQSHDPRLNRVFETIEERIAHLIDFVQGYGKFAKLPEPKSETVLLNPLLDSLAQQWTFSREVSDDATVYADPIQLEQLLINLLKNASESQSEVSDISIVVSSHPNYTVLEVCDRGVGMSDKVLNQALLPFYSTKPSGSGLGLALCREITDAHHGTISLQNREGGGVKVMISLPVS